MPYKDKEKQKEYLRMHYEKNKEKYRDTKSIAIKEWRLNNKEHISAYNSDYAKKHRDDINKRSDLFASRVTCPRRLQEWTFLSTT